MSRYQLQWYNLDQTDSGDWFVKMPLCDVYAPMIDSAFPSLNHIGWRPATKSACYTYLKNAKRVAIDRFRTFLELLKRVWVLQLNQSIAAHFGDELDQCCALDFNFQDAQTHTYTGIGQLEYAAKFQRDRGSIDKLAELLADVCSDHPNLRDVDHITAIPGNPDKDFHLPDLLVKNMAIHLDRKVGLDLCKTKKTRQLKNLSVKDKINALKGVYALNEDVEGDSVLLVDDLYQSGTTMWTLARLLKENGADRVYGLACVKSWRDTDNQ